MTADSFGEKVCIVTGGASGLGRELCRQLAAAGARVVLSDIDEAASNEIAAELAAGGHPIRVRNADVANSDSVRDLVENTLAEYGRIDYMFNNAGVPVWGEVQDLTAGDWHRTLDVNLMGVIHGIRHVYPIMIKQGYGHIVNTASGFGIIPGPLCSPYVASKFAVFGLSNAIRFEALALGINVSVVCPGFINTEMMTRKLKPVNSNPDSIQAVIPVTLLDVRKAARLLLNGVARKKAIITFPSYVRVFAFTFQYLPRLYSWFSVWQVAKFREIKKESKLS